MKNKTKKRKLSLKPRINRRNGQINVSLKRSDLPKDLVDDIVSVKKLDFLLEGWE